MEQRDQVTTSRRHRLPAAFHSGASAARGRWRQVQDLWRIARGISFLRLFHEQPVRHFKAVARREALLGIIEKGGDGAWEAEQTTASS